MAIPFPTTRVQLLSPGSADTEAEDWGGAPDVATGYEPVGGPVRAHLSGPSGSAFSASEGSGSQVTFKLVCDPCPIEPGMRVLNSFDGVTYDVAWCLNRPGPMPHVIAGLTYSTSSS